MTQVVWESESNRPPGGEAVQAQDQTSTIVGIDEAGYGPILGPLVVTAVAFDVPVSVMKEVEHPAQGPDLWQLLSRTVTRKASQRDPRLAVADSKKLKGVGGSPLGLGLLERGTLAFLYEGSTGTLTWRNLLARLCPEVVEHLDAYPWYAGRDQNLPVDCASDVIALQHAAVSRDLRQTGLRLRGACSEILPVRQYNRMVQATRNKATVLFSLAARLIQRVADTAGARPLRIWCDRQGGRISYRRSLMNAFPDADLDVLDETPDLSGYRLTCQPAPWVIRWVAKGESHHLPIALASMISKYVRELFMIQLNRYWSERVGDLRATAGYYQDGQRFLDQIASELARLRIDRDLLVRCR